MSVTAEQLEKTYFIIGDGIGVTARTETADFPSPAFTIASIATGDRVAEPLVPDTDVLLRSVFRYIKEELAAPGGLDVSISSAQAGVMAELGKSIIILDAERKVQPPLSDDERTGIGHVQHIGGMLSDMAARP